MRYSPNLNKRNVGKIIIRDDASTEVLIDYFNQIASFFRQFIIHILRFAPLSYRGASSEHGRC